MTQRHEMMVHRYTYYVLNNNLISDYEYDMLERKVREEYPDDPVVQGIGSSLANTYSKAVALDAINRNQ